MDFEFDAFSELYFKDYGEDLKTQRPVLLWHYTNSKGLMGIISPKMTDHLTFWFTRSDCMNDSSEGIDVIRCLRKAGKELHDLGRIHEEVYKATLREAVPNHHIISYPLYDRNAPEEDLKHVTFMDSAECETYLCCFSLANDELDMWRYYSKTGDGYSLELQSSAMFYELEDYEHANRLDTSVKYVKIKRLKVLYGDTEKGDFIQKALLDAERAYQIVKAKSGEDRACLRLNGFIDHLIQENQFRFKHPCFSSEKEYRFIAYRPIKKPKYMENELAVIKYRIQAGSLVPYIELPCDKSALISVQLSPFTIPDYAIGTTEDYLKHCGFPNTDVTRSTLPVRF